MVFLAWAVMLLGAFLVVWSSVLVIRASPEGRVRAWELNPSTPHAGWTQAVGAVLVVGGSVLFGLSQLQMVIGFIMITLLLSIGARVAHNRRVAGLDF